MLFNADLVEGQGCSCCEYQSGKGKQPPALSLGKRQGKTDRRDNGDEEVGNALIEAKDARLETERELPGEGSSQCTDTHEQGAEQPKAGGSGAWGPIGRGVPHGSHIAGAYPADQRSASDGRSLSPTKGC